MKEEKNKIEEVSQGITTQSDEYDELVAYKELRRKRKKKVAIRLAIYALLIICIPIFVFLTIIVVSPTKGHNFFGYTFYIVQTHSMEPEIMTNDCIVVKQVKSPIELFVGDDISFVRSTDGKVVTHRIVDIQSTAEGFQYVVRGINNPTDDEMPVKYENVLGKRVAKLAILGQTITFFRSPVGVVVMVIVFMAIVAAFVISFKLSEDIKAIGK